MGNQKPRWNLYLDDLRNPTEDHYEIARNVEEAKALTLQFGPPVFMSLDHDLGGDETSMQYLHWLAEEYFLEGLDEIPDYQIHSANPVGSKNIESFMSSWRRAAAL